MKKLLSVALAIFITCGISAQTTEAEANLKKVKNDTTDGWETGGTITVNLNQVALKNWSAGGQASVSASGLVNLFATYKKGNGLWENYLDIGYGSIKQDGNDGWRKSDDKIDFTSKYGQKASRHWYYAALLNFKTQMTEGNTYTDTSSTLISDFLAPAYLLGALGMDYKPNKNFTAFIAPLTAKATFVNNQAFADAGAFGVDPGKKSRVEIGGYTRIFYKKKIMENVDFLTKLDLFSNYIEDPQNIDVNWEVLISMKVNKFISATISTTLLYDHDIDIAYDENDPTKVGPRTQFKEVLGVGFSYKF
ncbi:MAG: DUF3078 domain-containing protein [Salinivirgaceae bacterium]|nr:DUF3078 domain-containing protein [Salinivirgaceae bacterium]